MYHHRLDDCLNYVLKDLLTELEVVMIGLDTKLEEGKPYSDFYQGNNSGNVAEELKTFVNECKNILLTLINTYSNLLTWPQIRSTKNTRRANREGHNSIC